MKRVLAVFGTRPEAIKMAPVVKELSRSPSIETRVCVTAQHRQMLDQVLTLFDITPNHDLDLMRPNQTLDQITAGVLVGVGQILDVEKPDLVLVHGDTTTTLAVSLAAFYRKLSVGHVEAGLRSGSLMAPWPEEMNRRVATLATKFHFAPTERSRANLLAENIPAEDIHVTGNTVIDALLETAEQVRAPEKRKHYEAQFAFLLPDKPLVLVTGHRRESFGDGFERICAGLRELADTQDLQIVYPVHPNPSVREPVMRLLSGHDRIHIVDPLDYEPFVALMDRSRIIITDSGGIQEEAPSLGKPILVMRETTERPEALEKGAVVLVGTSREKIVAEATKLLTDRDAYDRMAKVTNPYGDGNASRRIRKIIEEQL